MVMRTITNVWDKGPPFKSADFQQSKSQFWFADFQRDHAANVALLKSAQVECARTDCDAHK